MSGYIHSGVAGKMDKIRDANPGTILVTDKFGNAVESNVTLNDIVASGGGSEWMWNPTPVYDEILESDLDVRYTSYQIDLSVGYKAILLDIQPKFGKKANEGFVHIEVDFNNENVSPLEVRITNCLTSTSSSGDNSCTARAIVYPKNGIYYAYGSTVPKDGALFESRTLLEMYPRLWDTEFEYSTPLFDLPNLYINKIIISSSATKFPANTRFSVYAPVTA